MCTETCSCCRTACLRYCSPTLRSRSASWAPRKTGSSGPPASPKHASSWPTRYAEVSRWTWGEPLRCSRLARPSGSSSSGSSSYPQFSSNNVSAEEDSSVWPQTVRPSMNSSPKSKPTWVSASRSPHARTTTPRLYSEERGIVAIQIQIL